MYDDNDNDDNDNDDNDNDDDANDPNDDEDLSGSSSRAHSVSRWYCASRSPLALFK